MAKKKKKNPKKKVITKKTQNGIFSKINLTESYTSLILGAIVVVIIGILFLSFARNNKNMQTSSIMDIENIEELNPQNSNTSSTYTVNLGDDLWTISENIYNNGYRWVEIAKINKLENPGLIYPGNKLIIPTKIQEEVGINNISGKISITGSKYTIKSGDNLWDIAIRAYGDGYKWPEIAKANNIENPNLIFADNVLKIPR